jgi:hypothetical protein
MSEQNNSSRIQDGTAEGMLQFLDYVVRKGYGGPSSVNPWKSAARQVFQVVEQSDDFGSVNVRELDLDGYLDRFDTLAKPKIKVESVAAYRRRFTNAVEAYLAFIDTGKPPTFRQGRGRSKTEQQRPGATSAPAPEAGRTAATAGDGRGERMIEYPFPLVGGQVATLRLPVRFERADADRLSAFIRTLVVDSQREGSAAEDDPQLD